MHFTPKKFPSLTVYFEYTPEEKQTWDHPGYVEEFEFTEIEVGGTRIDEELESHLIETLAEEWEKELLNGRYI